MSNPQLQFFFVAAPRAKAGEPGRVACLAVSATAELLDLTTLTNPMFNQESDVTSQGAGALGSYITIVADGADVGVIFGTEKADVTGANVPALAAVGATDGDGVYTPSVKECYVIKNGTSESFLLAPYRRQGSGSTAPVLDRFLGFVGSAAGFMRIYQSSPAGLAASSLPVK